MFVYGRTISNGMEKEENSINTENQPRKGVIHFLLVHGYMIFFFAIVFGLILDTHYDNNFLQVPLFQNIGVMVIILGSLLVYWAQKSSSLASKTNTVNTTEKAFEYGPYKYFRNPTYLGLFIMILGLGLILNSLYSLIFAVAAHIIIKIFFVKKEERLLEVKYGEIYRSYKSKIKNII